MKDAFFAWFAFFAGQQMLGNDLRVTRGYVATDTKRIATLMMNSRHGPTLSPEALADHLRRLIAVIESGELSAGPTALAYLHGAMAALDALAGRRQFELPDNS